METSSLRPVEVETFLGPRWGERSQAGRRVCSRGAEGNRIQEVKIVAIACSSSDSAPVLPAVGLLSAPGEYLPSRVPQNRFLRLLLTASSLVARGICPLPSTRRGGPGRPIQLGAGGGADVAIGPFWCRGRGELGSGSGRTRRRIH